mmetsp:Transcript_47223/g.70270  ORF Transcript_47223/g.70270 Transcript_47223/m.70270 type:complete len:175 (-) Transcript_47223:68-592(-)
MFLAKGIVSSLREAWHVCDIEMIECVVRCSQELVRARVGGEGVLRSEEKDEEQKHGFDYIRTFARLAMEVCSLIAYRGDDSSTLDALRHVFVDRTKEIPELVRTVKDLHVRLQSLEESILTDKENSVPVQTVTNVYAKNLQRSHSHRREDDSWTISPKTKRVAKEYIAVYNSVS